MISPFIKLHNHTQKYIAAHLKESISGSFSTISFVNLNCMDVIMYTVYTCTAMYTLLIQPQTGYVILWKHMSDSQGKNGLCLLWYFKVYLNIRKETAYETCRGVGCNAMHETRQ